MRRRIQNILCHLGIHDIDTWSDIGPWKYVWRCRNVDCRTGGFRRRPVTGPWR